MQRTEQQLLTYFGRIDGDTKKVLVRAGRAFDLSAHTFDRWLERKAHLTKEQLVFLNEFSLGWYVRVASGGNPDAADIVRKPPRKEPMVKLGEKGTVAQAGPETRTVGADGDAKRVARFHDTNDKPYGLRGAPHAGHSKTTPGKRGAELPDPSTPQGREELRNLKAATDAQVDQTPAKKTALQSMKQLIGVSDG